MSTFMTSLLLDLGAPAVRVRSSKRPDLDGRVLTGVLFFPLRQTAVLRAQSVSNVKMGKNPHCLCSVLFGSVLCMNIY